VHELAFAQQVVRIVLSEMASRDAIGVRTIEVDLGALEGLRAEDLRGAFEVESENTPLRSADLRVTLVPPEARCARCGESYALPLGSTQQESGSLACLACGPPLEIRGGRGLCVRSASFELRSG